MHSVPPTHHPFAYLNHRGEAVLVEEIAASVHEALEREGIATHARTVELVMRALRHVTEAIAQEGGHPQGDVTDRVQAKLRQDHTLLTVEAVQAILRQLLTTLRLNDIVGVQYFEGKSEAGQRRSGGADQ